jgi:hypothetical protein
MACHGYEYNSKLPDGSSTQHYKSDGSTMIFGSAKMLFLTSAMERFTSRIFAFLLT